MFSWLRSDPRRRYFDCEGFVDRRSLDLVEGWVFDTGHPSRHIPIDLYCKEKLLTRAMADVFRQDLAAAGKGDGCHAFSIAIPPGSCVDRVEDLRICFGGTREEVTRPLRLNAMREKIANRYLKGAGVEIGALDNPLKTSLGCRVSYVDRLTPADLRRHYPELGARNFVDVDILSDGETLDGVADNSLDFLIASHMLEHCENPLGTLRSHLKKLKSGGYHFCVIPDKRFTLDQARELTDFDHLMADDARGPQVSRSAHYREWASCVVRDGTEEVIELEAKRLMQDSYSIHFHVWDQNSFCDFLEQASYYLGGSFETVCCKFNYSEVISVLRKK